MNLQDFITTIYPDQPYLILSPEELTEVIEQYEGWKKNREAEIRRKAVITTESIIEVVCAYFNIPTENMQSKYRGRENFVIPRQWVHFLAKRHTKESLSHIGMLTGGKDHASVLHSYSTISNLMEKYDHYVDELIALEAKLFELHGRKVPVTEPRKPVEKSKTEFTPQVVPMRTGGLQNASCHIQPKFIADSKWAYAFVL